MIQPYLITDGSSDAVLVPILNWLVFQYLDRSNRVSWMDFRDLQSPPDRLAEKIQFIIKSRQVDILFIHRDAEKQSPQQRIHEIQQSIQVIKQLSIPPVVCVIPVRMTEAWLLFDEPAIRQAVDNPNGKIKLNLPAIAQVEQLPNPKQVLYDLLKTATELTGRKLDRFKPEVHVHYVSDYITDFAPLRQLSAFQALEDDLQKLITAQGWNIPD